jgi:hypothetical protein
MKMMIGRKAALHEGRKFGKDFFYVKMGGGGGFNTQRRDLYYFLLNVVCSVLWHGTVCLQGLQKMYVHMTQNNVFKHPKKVI